MKSGSQDRILWTAAVLILVFVLGSLAALQYRWSKRVADATLARIDASLKASIMDWHLNLLRGVAEPCFAMQVASDPDSPHDREKYLQRYQAWLPTADHPTLFANLYLIDVSSIARDRIARLDPAADRLSSIELPARFDTLLRELHRQSADPQSIKRAATDDPTTTADNRPGQMPHDPLYGWQFDPDLPAILRPLLPRSPAQPITWIVIELDRQVLEQQLLPELAQHYFGGPQGANYDTAVVADHTGPVLYASSPDVAQRPFDHPDAVLDIFGPPSFGATPLSHDFSGDFHTAAANSPATAQKRGNMFAPSWLALMPNSGNDAHWNLIVHHRGGSLDAQMATIRLREFAISLSVLLILAAAMTMLIVATRRAQRLARLQMEFVATVSHELRTPLAVICSAADNLSDGVVRGQQQMARYGDTIKQQGQQLIALVEQILLFASTREARQVYHLELLDVERIVDVTLTNLDGLLNLSTVELESHVEPGLPRVVGDLAALSQCLQNLVINAVKYGGDAKWVGVTARQVVAGKSREVQIAIADRGIGMTSAELAHIFEPFYRSPQVAAAQIHGTGLGLPLAKTLAEAMSGSLSVESRPGHGSTFTLHLPFAEDSPLRAAVENASDKVMAG